MTSKPYTLDEQDEADIGKYACSDEKLMPDPVSSVRYSKVADSIVIIFKSGVTLGVPRRLLQGLTELAPGTSVLSRVHVIGAGYGIEWPELDVAHYVPGLLQGIYGNERWMSELGRAGGRAKSPRKAAAARANGRKGGRPRKDRQAA